MLDRIVATLFVVRRDDLVRNRQLDRIAWRCGLRDAKISGGAGGVAVKTLPP